MNKKKQSGQGERLQLGGLYTLVSRSGLVFQGRLYAVARNGKNTKLAIFSMKGVHRNA